MNNYLFYDIFYQDVIKRGINPYSAGYIDTFEIYDNNKISQYLNDFGKEILLFATGGFAPFHEGHKNMIDIAKKWFEDRGFNIKVVIVVDSQDYVNTKEYMTLSYEDRVKSIPSEYIVDTYERDSGPLNFTFHMLRLQKLYPKHIIFFLCGSDNYNLTIPFENIGHSVCVERDNVIFLSDFVKNDRCIYLKNNDKKLKKINSTDIRKFGNKNE